VAHICRLCPFKRLLLATRKIYTIKEMNTKAWELYKYYAS
jgi:hypothetical protein